MQITTVLASLFFAAAVSAKGGKNGTSIKSQCSDIAKFTKMSELLANETKLASKFDNNQTAIDAFKAKAAKSATELTTLSSNATLVEACGVIAAHSEAVQACGSIQDMEKTIEDAANTTKLETKFKGNATKIASFQDKASKAATKLADLQANSTLSAFCAVQADAEMCSKIKSWQKDIAAAADTAALSTKFDGNTTKVEKFQAQAAKAQTKLDAVSSNSTLMSTCSSLAQASTDSKTTSGTVNSTSFAGRLQVTGAATVAALFMAMFGMLMM